MKKVIIGLFIALMLTGCSGDGSKTYFLKNKDDSYDLYSESGKQKTEKKYKSYSRVNNDGFLVVKDDTFGFISTSGKELIKTNTYKKIMAIKNILVAYNDKDEITIFDTTGKELYRQSDKVEIKMTGLPIVKKDKEYMVITPDGKEYAKSKNEIVYADIYDNRYILVNYEKKLVLQDIGDEKSEAIELDVTGKYVLMGYHDKKGYLVYDEHNEKTLLINNAGKVTFALDAKWDKIYFDDAQNIVGQLKNKTSLINDEGQEIVVNSYFQSLNNYVVKNAELIYGPHTFYKDGKEVVVENIQLDPQAGYINKDLFPVYLRNKGYVYYGFDGKQAFDKIFLKAENFDEFGCAVVSSNEDKFYLIDTSGKKLSDEYVNIELMNNGYYAGYTTDNRYVVLDATGKQVIDMVFMGSKEVAKYNNQVYGLFEKNGKTYIYEMTEYQVVFEVQGTAKFHKEGYFVVDDKTYYTMKGEKIHSR